MERIKLSNGLILFGGMKRMGKTLFTLKLANYIANNEKVLFLSFQDYHEKLQNILLEMDGFIEDNLEINSSLDYYKLHSFIRLIDYLKTGKFTTIIIDDLHSYFNCESYDSIDYDANEATDPLLFLSNLLNIRVIINVRIAQSNPYDNSYSPKIRHFIWTRSLIDTASQVYAIFRPYSCGIKEDEDGNSLSEVIEIYSLKNEKHEEEIILLNNLELNVFPKRYPTY
jgi:hypothetical protein